MRRRKGATGHDLRPLWTADLPSHGPIHRWHGHADVEGLGSRGRSDFAYVESGFRACEESQRSTAEHAEIAENIQGFSLRSRRLMRVFSHALLAGRGGR